MNCHHIANYILLHLRYFVKACVRAQIFTPRVSLTKPPIFPPPNTHKKTLSSLTRREPEIRASKEPSENVDLFAIFWGVFAAKNKKCDFYLYQKVC